MNTRMNTSSNTSFECWVSVTILALVVRPGNTQPKQPAVRAANQARLGLAWIKNNTDRRHRLATDDRRRTTDDWEMQRRSVERGAWKRQQRQPNSTIQLVADTKSNWLHGREAQTELNWTELSNAATTSRVERRRRWERRERERERERHSRATIEVLREVRVDLDMVIYGFWYALSSS